jgi:hypothetical protein
MATVFARPKLQLFGVSTAFVVRKIGLSDLGDALRLSWEDFNAIPTHAVVLCVIYPIIGLVLFRLVLGYSLLLLLFPLAAGFTLIGPFAALGLYELSRPDREAAIPWGFGGPNVRDRRRNCLDPNWSAGTVPAHPSPPSPKLLRGGSRSFEDG